MFARCVPSVAGIRPRKLRLVAGQTGSYSSSPDSSRTQDASSNSNSSATMSEQVMEHQFDLFSPIDILRRNILGHKAIFRSRDIKSRLANQQQEQDEEGRPRKQYPSLPQRLREFDSGNDYATVKSMDLLRFQVRACKVPEDITRVITVAWQNEESRALFMLPQIQRLMCKVLESKDEARALVTLNIFLIRIDSIGGTLTPEIIIFALQLAASLHAVTAFKRWLSIWEIVLKQNKIRTSTVIMRTWLRSLLRGFSDTTSPDSVLRIMYGSNGRDEQHDFGLLKHYILMRAATDESGKTIKLWLLLLARCKDEEWIRQEWALFVLRRDRPAPALSGFIQAFISIDCFDDARRVIEDYGHLITAPKEDELWKVLLNALEKNGQLLDNITDEAKTVFGKGLAYALEEKLVELETELGLKWVQQSNTETRARSRVETRLDHVLEEQLVDLEAEIGTRGFEQDDAEGSQHSESIQLRGHHEFIDDNPSMAMERVLNRLSKVDPVGQ